MVATTFDFADIPQEVQNDPRRFAAAVLAKIAFAAIGRAEQWIGEAQAAVLANDASEALRRQGAVEAYENLLDLLWSIVEVLTPGITKRAKKELKAEIH